MALVTKRKHIIRCVLISIFVYLAVFIMESVSFEDKFLFKANIDFFHDSYLYFIVFGIACPVLFVMNRDFFYSCIDRFKKSVVNFIQKM